MGKYDFRTLLKKVKKRGLLTISQYIANHASYQSYRDTHRGAPETGENLVRITHIMLKKRFYLTTENSCGILTMSIRIEDSLSTREEGRHREPSEILGEDWECPVRYSHRISYGIGGVCFLLCCVIYKCNNFP